MALSSSRGIRSWACGCSCDLRGRCGGFGIIAADVIHEGLGLEVPAPPASLSRTDSGWDRLEPSDYRALPAVGDDPIAQEFVGRVPFAADAREFEFGVEVFLYIALDDEKNYQLVPIADLMRRKSNVGLTRPADFDRTAEFALNQIRLPVAFAP